MAFYNLKPKLKHIERLDKYYEQLLLDVATMLEYDNVYNGLNTDWMERYKIQDGGCGIGLIDGKVTAFQSIPSGRPDAYGIGTELVGATPIGSFNGEIGKNCVFAWNNSLGFADDTDIEQMAEVLAELDLSIWYNIKYARIYPVPIAKNNKIKNLISSIFKHMSEGELLTIADEVNVKESINGTRVPPVEVLNLTDATLSDKIQYLSRAKDDTLRAFYTRRGMGMMNSTKAAQQTVNETQENDLLSMIYPLNRLKMANKMCDELNALFGGNMSVHFSAPWELQYKKVKAAVDAICNDPVNEKIYNDPDNEEDINEEDDTNVDND